MAIELSRAGKGTFYLNLCQVCVVLYLNLDKEEILVLLFIQGHEEYSLEEQRSLG